MNARMGNVRQLLTEGEISPRNVTEESSGDAWTGVVFGGGAATVNADQLIERNLFN